MVAYETQNQKSILKKIELYDVVWEEKMLISKISEFSILPYTWNRKLGNLEKLWFTLVFYRFGYIKHRED